MSREMSNILRNSYAEFTLGAHLGFPRGEH